MRALPSACVPWELMGSHCIGLRKHSLRLTPGIQGPHLQSPAPWVHMQLVTCVLLPDHSFDGYDQSMMVLLGVFLRKHALLN